MRVDGDAGYAFEAEVEGLGFEACLLQEGDEEAAETAVDVEGEALAQGEFGERGNGVNYPVRVAGGAADQQDRVGVDEPGYRGEVGAVGWSWAGDEVQADLKVGGCFPESGVCCFGEYPERKVISKSKGRECKVGYGTCISGSVTPRSIYAFCRALRTAMRILSVPPEVVTPAAPGGALNMARTCARVST